MTPLEGMDAQLPYHASSITKDHVRNTEIHLKRQTVHTAPTAAPGLKGRDEGSGARGPWAGPQTAYLVGLQTSKMYVSSIISWPCDMEP